MKFLNPRPSFQIFIFYFFSLLLINIFNQGALLAAPAVLTWVTKEKMLPTEMQLLTQCLREHSHLLSSEMFEKVNQSIETLNVDLNFLGQKNSMAFIKGELYLFLIERSNFTQQKKIDPMPWFQEFLKTSLSDHCDFTKWFMQALYQDGLKISAKRDLGNKNVLFKQALQFWKNLLENKKLKEQKIALLEQYFLFLQHLTLKLNLFKNLTRGPKVQETFFVRASSTLSTSTMPNAEQKAEAEVVKKIPEKKSPHELLDELLEKN